MAERFAGVRVEVAPLSRALLDGAPEPNGPRHRVDLVVLPCFEDERPLQGLAGLVDWRMSGRLSTLLRDGFFTGAAGEAVLLPGRQTLPMARLVLIGLGPGAAFDRARAEATGERLVTLVDRLDPQDVLLAMPGRVSERAVVEAVFDGLTRALRRLPPRPGDGAVRRAVRAVEDDATVATPEAPAEDDPPPRGPEEGVVPLEAVGEAAPPGDRPMGVAPTVTEQGSEGSVRVGAPGPPGVSSGVRRWWVVADPRHEARLRRLLEGPPRAAERGA